MANWPDISWNSWRDTAQTLQLWTQIVGKVRLALTPWLNHGWQVPLYVTARGLGTGPMPFGDGEILDIEFDFLAHRLVCRSSRGGMAGLALRPRSVADFHDRLLAVIAELGVAVAITPLPNEIADPLPFAQDHLHASYDGAAVERFWQALVRIDTIFRLFRTGFLGKASPVHFFWGSFDLAATRFSGRLAPPHPGGVPYLPDAVTREAYSHEVSSAGFWPGSDAYPNAAFYSYAYPVPPGFAEQPVPKPAHFDRDLGEFVLSYDAVRAAPVPDALLLEFLQASYVAAANCGHWDRNALECDLGVPARPRPA